MYYATLRHHSVSRAREIACGDDLSQAKRKASKEFGDDFEDYEIVIHDGEDVVATRRVGNKCWARRSTWN